MVEATPLYHDVDVTLRLSTEQYDRLRAYAKGLGGMEGKRYALLSVAATKVYNIGEETLRSARFQRSLGHRGTLSRTEAAEAGLRIVRYPSEIGREKDEPLSLADDFRSERETFRGARSRRRPGHS